MTFTDPVTRSPMPWVKMVTSPRDGSSGCRVRAPKEVVSRLPVTSTIDPASMSSPSLT